MKENDIIRKLIKQHGEKDFLDWAAKENVKPTTTPHSTGCVRSRR